MKTKQLLLVALLALTCMGCGRSIRTAQDITPGNIQGEKMDWRYGAADIRVQTAKLTRVLMDRWYRETGYDFSYYKKPRIVITEVDNRTDMYISTDMIRDIFEGVAVTDGRFTVTVGDAKDERELDKVRAKANRNSSTERVKAPELLAKVRITKAVTSDSRFDFEDYRMTVTLYDVETQEIVDSAWDVLRKKVRAY